MILKEHQLQETRGDRFQRAGDQAERQMAHYLQRAFGGSGEIHVFNNLRFERSQGDAAQIDHLVMHRGGMVIVESKSVSTAVRINEREEWSRRWEGQWHGMPSPVLQAERQADLLRCVLQDHCTELRRRSLFGLRQEDFGQWPIDTLVAISDQGLLEAKGQRPSVCKADQVPGRVQTLLGQETARGRGTPLNAEEFERLSRFLLMKHRDRPPRTNLGPAPSSPAPSSPAASSPAAPRPEARRQPPAPPAPQSQSAAAPACSKCRSTHWEIQYSQKYRNSYFRCRDCQASSPLRRICPACGKPARIRKQGAQFYAECGACGHSEQFFTNP